MNLSPIILFVFDRPNHTLRTLQALANNKLADQSSLYIYCDGPKEGADKSMITRIKKVREIAASSQWCKEVTIIVREKNFGLKKNIITGISKHISEQESIIVLEDDIVTDSNFLSFMNEALNKYRELSHVAGISGWTYDIEGLPSTFFSKVGACWGWATWQRTWDKTSFDTVKSIKYLKKSGRAYEFDVDGSYPFYKMLIQGNLNKVSSWAISFYTSYFQRDELFLFPSKSLVNNIGNDGSGTNSGDTKQENEQVILGQSEFLFPANIEENIEVRSKISQTLRKQNGLSKTRILLNSLLNKLNLYTKRHI